MIRYSFIFLFLIYRVHSCALAGEVFDPPVSARASGLSYAGSTVQARGYAPYWNPSLLSRLDGWGLALDQYRVRRDSQLYWGSFSTPLGKKLGGSISWSHMVITDQDRRDILRDENGQIVVDPQTGLPFEVIVGFSEEVDNVFSAGLGFGTQNFSIGGTFKMAYLLFAGDRALGAGSDFGLSLRRGPWTWGGSIKDAGHLKIVWKNGAKIIVPPSYRSDISFEISDLRLFEMKSTLRIFLGGQRIISSGQINTGVEYSLLGLVDFRMGFSGSDFSTGLGFRVKRLVFDYSFTQSTEFYSNHRISVIVSGKK